VNTLTTSLSIKHIFPLPLLLVIYLRDLGVALGASALLIAKRNKDKKSKADNKKPSSTTTSSSSKSSTTIPTDEQNALKKLVELKPSKLGKINAASQILLVLSLLVSEAMDIHIPKSVVGTLSTAIATSTLVSGINYGITNFPNFKQVIVDFFKDLLAVGKL
jgi:hypothetical protein